MTTDQPICSADPRSTKLRKMRCSRRDLRRLLFLCPVKRLRNTRSTKSRKLNKIRCGRRELPHALFPCLVVRQARRCAS
ncbi:hypothetical protein NDU88_000965 [Pleurodeles waltl]|uniref:Uncharacterized protein n=1 Tax=Pleurodeles waltl TaxID=8319 RepID=A0AAV7R7M9_PLEWA|nr:hypothetical protein NDU88_000964 [Pleurodeles waltl]KAJ1148125.1 hypothetical protein NDU88_000965 [Pleurodeles waltl]